MKQRVNIYVYRDSVGVEGLGTMPCDTRRNLADVVAYVRRSTIRSAAFRAELSVGWVQYTLLTLCYHTHDPGILPKDARPTNEPGRWVEKISIPVYR
jgi:hypothetical protein